MDYHKFAPRMDNTKCENTGNRPKEYSIWHRSLGAEFYAVDIDFVEFRANRGIVAFIAVSGQMEDENHIINSKPYIWKRTELERAILKQLSDKMCIPSFFVLHTKDLSIFHIHTIGEDLEKFTKMNKEEYAEFIKAL